MLIRWNKSRLKDRWNTWRGDPIRWDLSDYRTQLAEIHRLDLREAADGELKDRSSRLREKAEANGITEDIVREAGALVRETARRTVGLEPYDVQMLAGLAMQQGNLVQMDTGEGKTLAAVLPAYIHALTGRGVHVHTFNDYLARRDAAWMGPVYTLLGLRVGCIQQGMAPEDRKKAYDADITYSTAKEAGFDYLRDSLCFDPGCKAQRDFHAVIVDEADSILIDEARVPLVLAGVSGEIKADPGRMAEIAKGLREGTEIETDDGRRNIFLTDIGLRRVEAYLGRGSLHAAGNTDLLTHLNLALHAEFLIHRDVDYIVRDGKIKIVDEFTGRVVEDRHWPDGLQAAVEAKEKLSLGSGGSILGSITLQHFLKLYPQISGMTATALPSAEEIQEFYGLKTVVIPPHRPCVRRDEPDVVFTHSDAKAQALVTEIESWHSKGRPVLVGTASVEESERLASGLEEAGISCQVLNAKNDEAEAGIIAQAGAMRAVTISTNMAGRGTDIKLGGDQEQQRDAVVKLGGLYVIGTNRHQSLRVDQQLRGRAGRQGDPGSSRFFISLEDDLVERYGIRNLLPKKVQSLKQKAPLADPLVNREIERGQRIIEGQNFEIRKTLWQYSSLMEKQRYLMHSRRREVLDEEAELGLIEERLPELYRARLAGLGTERMRQIEKRITLYQIDRYWAEHLSLVSDIRESIHLVSVGGNSPLNEFHKHVNAAFLELDKKIEEKICQTFRDLAAKQDGMDLDAAGIRGPSSTWTYLINDQQFGSWVGLLAGSNIGFTSGAAGLAGPLYVLLGLLRRRRWRRKNPLAPELPQRPEEE
jgi:preprotein translocase subunit SecA